MTSLRGAFRFSANPKNLPASTVAMFSMLRKTSTLQSYILEVVVYKCATYIIIMSRVVYQEGKQFVLYIRKTKQFCVANLRSAGE